MVRRYPGPSRLGGDVAYRGVVTTVDYTGLGTFFVWPPVRMHLLSYRLPIWWILTDNPVIVAKNPKMPELPVASHMIIQTKQSKAFLVTTSASKK